MTHEEFEENMYELGLERGAYTKEEFDEAVEELINEFYGDGS